MAQPKKIDHGYSATQHATQQPSGADRCIVCGTVIDAAFGEVCSWACGHLQNTRSPNLSPMIYKVYGFCGIDKEGNPHGEKEVKGVKMYRDDMEQRCGNCRYRSTCRDICVKTLEPIDNSMVCDGWLHVDSIKHFGV